MDRYLVPRGSLPLLERRLELQNARVKWGPRLTKRTLFYALRKQRGRCYYCEKDMLRTSRKHGLHYSFQIEHRLPVSRGGNHTPSNIVLACWRCNRAKHTQTDTEFKPIAAELQKPSKSRPSFAPAAIRRRQGTEIRLETIPD